MEEAQKLAGAPLLGTLRLEAEGGGWSPDEGSRLALLDSLATSVDGFEGFDWELKAQDAEEMVALVHNLGLAAIGSSHYFDETPSVYKLEEEFLAAQEAGFDYVKFAMKIDNWQEYSLMASFVAKHHSDGVIVVGMGEKFGPLSRTMYPRIGSRLTYAYAGDQPVAPGQMYFEAMHQYFMDTHAAYARRHTIGS